MSRRSNSGIYVRNPDIVRAWIRYLHDISGVTYRQIAEKPYFSGMPPGTICALAHGAEWPRKHGASMGVVLSVTTPACPTCGGACTYDCGTQRPVTIGAPRHLSRCTIYPGTAVDKIIADLYRVTGRTFAVMDGEIDW